MNRLRLMASVNALALILCVIVLSRDLPDHSPNETVVLIAVLAATVINIYKLLELLPQLFRKD